MNIREVLGLSLIISALVLVPVAWPFSRLLWLLAFVLFVIGAWLFYTERVIRKEEQMKNETGASSLSGNALPTDIHNYSGWRTGGRSESSESELGGSGDGD